LEQRLTIELVLITAMYCVIVLGLQRIAFAAAGAAKPPPEFRDQFPQRRLDRPADRKNRSIPLSHPLVGEAFRQPTRQEQP
jgi:hypothetical protein